MPFDDLVAGKRPLDASFYDRATAVVARELIGCQLVCGDVAGRIVETEAYLGPEDLASHAAPGPTTRNAAMFGPSGISYVYFIYGMYYCVNAVAYQGSVAGAVLIRGVEPQSGIEQMFGRRPSAQRWQDLASGPGKLTKAFGIGREHNGLCLAKSPLRILEPGNQVPSEVAVSPRVGIRKCADWPLRFFERGNPCVSRSPLNRSARVEEQGVVRR